VELASAIRGRAAQRRYYRRNTAAILKKQRDRRHLDKDKLRETRSKIYANRRDKLSTIKLAAGCADCGYRAHAAALDFDHLDGTEKKFQMASCYGRPWKNVLAEIAKCEVVCANCHRIRTFNRRREKPCA